MRAELIAITVLILALVWGDAQADVCVKIDESRDTLSENERKAAVTLMESGFRKAGETVVDAPCNQTFLLSNARLGRTIATTIKGPRGARTFQVQRIEDLGAALEQMAHSMVTGSVLGNSAGRSISRHNVMRQQISPNRIENDVLAYLAIGPGAIIGADVNQMPVLLGGGLRYELDGVALDIGAQLVTDVGSRSGQSSSIMGSLGAAYFFDPIANQSSFLGGSVGLGGITAMVDDHPLKGGGLHARVFGGFEFFRASLMRLIVQADLSLPLYRLSSDDTDANTPSRNPMYAPIFGFTVGGAFASPKNSREIRVRHL